MNTKELYEKDPIDDPEFPNFVYDVLDILYEEARLITDRKKRREYINQIVELKTKWLGEDAPNQRIK